MLRLYRPCLLARAAVVAAAFSSLMACGNATAMSDGAKVAARVTPYAVALSQPWPIHAVARTANPRVVAVSIVGIPTPAAPGLCHADVSYQLSEAPLTIGIGVSVSSRMPAPYDGCPTAARRLLVRLKSPLGKRDVFASDRVSPQGGRFVAVGSGYVECRPPSCNPMYEPVVPDCMHLRDAIAGTDMPAHFGMNGPCRMPFAAIVVDIGAGACPVTGETNPCAGKRLTRQFWYSDGKFWKLLLQGKESDCGDARRVFARFPLSLCSTPEWARAASR